MPDFSFSLQCIRSSSSLSKHLSSTQFGSLKSKIIMQTEILSQAATQARGLAIDAIHACSSGHLGLPLGCAEIGAVLYGAGGLRYNPAAPKWLNRDRFVLSGGHGSMFLYSWLHIAGYALSLDEVKNFRKLGSETPGHPEFGDTVGVEATTGPLGQGIGNAVGYALSAKHAAAKFNTAEHTIFDQHIFALHGDGCLQEGVAKEAIAFAGHNKLDNLILIYDSNDVTLDAMADRTQSEDVNGYFTSQGWDTITIDGHDLAAIEAAISLAKSNDNGQPKVIIAKTTIGKGIPEVEGTSAGHGEGGAKFAESARKGLGLPAETFYVSDEVRAHFATVAQAGAAAYAEWQKTFTAWSAANPELAAELNGDTPTELLSSIPEFDAGTKAATRASGGTVLQSVAKALPNLISGSADLYGSTKNYIKDGGDFGPENYAGRNIWFGIREHAMGAICNGIAYDGIFKASGATFLVFADYLRGSIRIASLAKLPVSYIFTHDSVGVGEDGPTHQPVETVSGLRVIPNLDVIRPADAEETAGAFAAAMQREDGPTALILTRQNVPAQDSISISKRREGVLKGGYIAKKESGALKLILMATGSELQHAMGAAEQLGDGVRVVSLPCFERFERQSAEYIESVLPSNCTARVAVEAGVSSTWGKYIGLTGKTVCIDRFGFSAPGDTVMAQLGMTADNVAAVAKDLL
jgi:transketolase